MGAVAETLSTLGEDFFAELDYSHHPLTEQLEDHGIRQFEIDVMADPEGGLYSSRVGPAFVGEDGASGIPELDHPGFKVLHIQDIDYETTCFTLIACLGEIEEWSSANPNHLPVMIMIENKADTIEEGAAALGVEIPPLPFDFAIPPQMTPELFVEMEAEILSVFPQDQILTPDDVRGDADTLEEAVLDGGWPEVDDLRGKVMFALVDTGDSADVYLEGTPSLEGRIAFTSSTPGTPDAAFIRVDDSIADGADLAEWAEAGYLIRTRTDVPGDHAKNGDTSLRESAFASGGHFLSTDYYVENPEFGTGFVVALPGGADARCNPVTAPPPAPTISSPSNPFRSLVGMKPRGVGDPHEEAVS
jgi:hypothetical protein